MFGNRGSRLYGVLPDRQPDAYRRGPAFFVVARLFNLFDVDVAELHGKSFGMARLKPILLHLSGEGC